MKRYAILCAFGIFAALYSLSSSASIVDNFTCRSGDTPKFEDNEAVFHIEPFLWDNENTRSDIIDAFETWNGATGWKMQFKYVRGEGRGKVGDGQYQVRSAWLYDNPQLGYSVNGKSAALPDSDPDQCHWYDSDIELGLRNFRDGEYFHPNLSLYSLMVHEIGHALGLQHSDLLSAVNTDSRSAGGLFGYDIQFARALYGVSSGNIKRNFRADRIALVDGKLRNSFIVEYRWAESTLSVPYAVTNTGVIGESVAIEFIYGESRNDLFSDKAAVLDRMDVYIGAGQSVNGHRDLKLSEQILNSISQAETFVGFRVVPEAGVDSGPWDDVVRTY